MSAEYSVDGILAVAEAADNGDVRHPGMVADMLREFARIKADERGEFAECPICKGWSRHPPAQAAQVDGDNDAHLTVMIEHLTSIIEGKANPATHPHSPDAADSGRVGDGLVEALRDEAKLHHGSNAADETHDLLLRAAAALAAQGQDEAVAEILSWKNNATPVMRYFVKLDRLPAGTKLYSTPPASPAGVPDGWHKAVEQVKRLSGIHLKAGTDATDGLFKLAVAHGANETAAAVLAHDANGEINELQSCVFAVARLAMLAAAPSTTPEGGEVDRG